MCGIAGIYSTSFSPEIKRGKLAAMIQAMRHRGPDGTSIYADDLIGIATTRLAIVDPHSQHRLSWDENNRYFLAFNGEIYNHKELRQQQGKDVRWLSGTDTEVVAKLASSKAQKSLEHLSGDFAIAFWDSVTRTGFIARDRLGVKPLYYAFVPAGIAFASEVRALLKGFPELASINPAAIGEYLTLRFVASPNTAYTSVKKLPPGCWLRLCQGEQFTPRTYWDIRLRGNQLDANESAVELARSLLEDAVRARLPDEVGCGVLLSGGLDSSLVTAIAAQNSSVPVRTYSAVYLEHHDDLEVSEHSASRLVSETYCTDHSELSVGAVAFRDAADSTVRHLEDLVADPPSVLRGMLCKAAASTGVRVLLSGEGADELFAGYSLYSELLASHDPYSGMGRLLTERQKRWLLTPDFLGQIASDGGTALQRPLPQGGDRLQQMLYTDCKYWLVDDLLMTADKTGMMSSVEVRVPFLDHSIVDLAFSLSSRAKLSAPLSKAFLRKVAATYLPAQIVEGQKRGFPLPLGCWLRGKLSGWVAQLVLDSLVHRGYFRQRSLRKLMVRYLCGPSDRLADHIVWALVVLELFLQHGDAARRYEPPSGCHEA